jgi:hypothetical protein
MKLKNSTAGYLMQEANIWGQLFDQIHPAAKWFLTVTTLGGYTLAAFIWKRHQERIRIIEGRLEGFATHNDMQSLRDDVRGVQATTNRILFHLMGDTYDEDQH